LNFAMFRFPWPWDTWTARTPNALFFTVCLLGLTLACVTIGRRQYPHELRPSLSSAVPTRTVRRPVDP
jgi:hypothetical protein